ncbi:hypothetical protein FHETE_5852 [Fusarium heterosporum]|uniref:Zn(2)-C6 fungal-type domain-containing protein n=1 Tax=Fusarium heterosporum TaxID=42747 RepID=A0A8H5T7L0_FUSHE|nr:hypothetical protein FHETE_5852 [Fusarium heterosporum]
MGSTSKFKACYACTNGKRKCDKAQPICGRCNDRDVECRYPVVKRKTLHTPAFTPERSSVTPGVFGFAQIAFSPPTHDVIDLHEWTRSLGNWSSLPAPEIQNESPANTTSSTTLPSHDSIEFFLKPDTWAIRHIPLNTPVFSNSVCMNYVSGIREFFTEWVTSSHSPFIHNQLYADSGLPGTIQDAFTCIVLNNTKTPENETVIDEMLASKMSSLLKSYTAYSQADQNTDDQESLTTREHLARTQALFVHLVLALFSPSIGARASSEQHIQTLLSWTRQLWEVAIRDPEIAPVNNDSGSATTHAIVVDALFDNDPLPRIWRSWVLSESIRRIWLMATSTIGVYLTLRQKWAECHGGIYFTARRDLWDAKSASTWAKAIRRSDPLFVCSLQCESLFLTAKASEVDKMLVNMFTIMWGVERVENWVARTAEPGDDLRVWKGADLPMEKGRMAVI